MKNIHIFKLLAFLVLFLSNGLTQELSKIERDKRHIVSRTYQMTYGMLQICPDKEADSFKKIIEEFEKTYPEFTQLLKESQYYQYAVDNMAKDIQRERQKPDESRMSQCLYGQYLTKSLTSTASGQKTVREMQEKLMKYSSPSSEQNSSDTENDCRFKGIDFPDDMIIFAGGAYSGEKIDYQIDQSGHQATQFDVLVNSSERPVALILGAYEPSIWNISWTSGTNIKAVVLTGYHKQVVAGLPNDVAILNSSHHNSGPCGHIYISDKYLQKINPLSNKVFEKNVTMVYYAEKGKITFGGPIDKNEILYTSQDSPPSSFFDTSKPIAGQAGLKDLVAKGMLRESTSSDMERWVEEKEIAYMKILKEKNEELPPVANAKTRTSSKNRYIHNGYVILKKITIPAGLYGANSATFFLEKGVPFPDGKLGHSTLYDFNTIECYGTACKEH
ncbi:MAG: hypothetical protein J7D61_16025 [Marichromatium sp.]|nr:hypothetical protein [Marichromatium sp.]